MFKVCNNGPRMAVMARGNAERHYSHPRAIITDLEHITGPIVHCERRVSKSVDECQSLI